MNGHGLDKSLESTGSLKQRSTVRSMDSIPIAKKIALITEQGNEVFDIFDENNEELVKMDNLPSMLENACHQKMIAHHEKSEVEKLVLMFNDRRDDKLSKKDWIKALKWFAGYSAYEGHLLHIEVIGRRKNKVVQTKVSATVQSSSRAVSSSIKSDSAVLELGVEKKNEDQKLIEPQEETGICEILLKGLLNSLPQLNRSLISTYGYVIINQSRELNLIGHIAIYNLVRAIFFMSLNRSLQSLMAINTSQSLAQVSKIALVKKFFTQTLLISALFIGVLYVPLMLFGNKLFMMAGMSQNIAMGARMMAIKLFASDALELANNIVKSFCNSQHLEGVFVTISFVTLVPFFIVSAYLSFYHGMGYDGWIVAKTVYQILCMWGSLHIYWFKTIPATRGLCSISEALEGLVEYAIQGLYFWVSSLSAVIGWEIGTFFVGLKNDHAQIEAYGSMINSCSLVIDLNSGYVIYMRTRMNYFLGKEKWKAAKRVASK